MPGDIPNPAWLHGGTPSANQQAFGATLLAAHAFVLFPSAVSKLSWNLVFEPGAARGKYRLRSQERLVVDTRLNPPSA
jgi:RES domain-containing protein